LSNSEILVKVEGVSKKFCRDLKRSLWYGVKDISSELFGSKKNGQLRPKEFWAVDDVSFELKRGECLGLIGHNGAGKSTLLKMLNGLIKPDKGKITMHGRIGALIELGSGFNPILTGRENIYNNGAVLGFSKKEIDAKFEAIVEFAEIDDFIDTPVQNYSSGMKVRLGFAVAAQMEPDVLLIDEVLAVGDVGFKIKCYNEIFRIARNAVVIFVSHSMPQVGKICNRGILLKKGSTEIMSSDISKVISGYYFSFGDVEYSIEGSRRAEITELSVNSVQIPLKEYGDVAIFKFNSASNKIFFKFKIKEPLLSDKCLLQLSISDTDQKVICQDPHILDLDMNKAQYEIKILFDSTIFNTGKYSISIHIFDYQRNTRGEILIGYRNIIRFGVKAESFNSPAPILIKSEWKNN
jgi:lipopolysaccharide transport system ATP-binding protein